jgi:hypothetical protein
MSASTGKVAQPCDCAHTKKGQDTFILPPLAQHNHKPRNRNRKST